MFTREEKYLNACSNGDIEMISHMLETNEHELIDCLNKKKNKFLSECLIAACRTEHINIINKIMTHIGKSKNNMLDNMVDILPVVLGYACEAGNLKIINAIVKLCNKSFDLAYLHNVWIKALHSACEGGHIKICKMFMDKIRYDGYASSAYSAQCIFSACKSGKLDVVRLILNSNKNGRIIEVDVNKGLQGACIGGHVQIAKFMINIGARNFQDAFYYACKSRCVEIVEFMVKKCNIKHYARDRLTECLSIACSHGGADVVKFLLKCGITRNDECLNWACEGGDLEIVKILIDAETTDVNMLNMLNSALLEAYKCNNLELVSYLLTKGATFCDCALESYNFLAKSTTFCDRALENYAYSSTNVDIFHLLVNETEKTKIKLDFSYLKNDIYLQTHRVYCKFKKIDPKNDSKYENLLQKFPPYVLLSIRTKCCVNKLPKEIFRLLFTYLTY